MALLLPRSAADYLAALKAHLPTGPVWPRDDRSALSQVCEGIATTVARLHGRADALLDDSFPATTYDLLPEWEASLGLPDPCAGENQTFQQRRNHVVARLGARGGQSKAYYTARAAALGFDITIDEFSPFRAGEAVAGDPVNGEEWAFAWRINAPETTITSFAAGSGSAGEPLATWGNDVLACEMRRIAPAHTTLLIGFPAAGEAPPPDDEGLFIAGRQGLLLTRSGGFLAMRPPITVSPGEPIATMPDGAITMRDGSPIATRSGALLLKRTISDPVVVVPVDPDPPVVVTPPATTYPTGPHLRLEAPHGNVIIESQDGVNAVVRLVRPIYWLDRLMNVSHFNTSLGNVNTFYTYKGPGDLLGIINGEPALMRDITSLDDGTFETQIFEGMSDGSFLQLNVTFKIAPTRTGAVPAPSPIPSKASVVFREEFAPGTGSGALNRVYGNVTNTSEGLLLLGRASAMTQTDPANRVSNDYGFGNGLYEYYVRFIGDLGNAGGPALVLWPSSDLWPGPEVDLGEFWPDGKMYMANHWKDASYPVEGNQQDRKTIWTIPAVFDPHVLNVLGARLMNTGVIFYKNGVEFARDETSPPPKDFSNGGQNHTIGLLSGSDYSSDGGPSGLLCRWLQFTPEALLPPT